MSSIRRLFFAVCATALVAFALPAAAATKSVSATPPAGPLSAGVQQIVVIYNNTGNSNANSFELDWIPTANFSVQGGFLNGDPSNAGTLKSPGVFGGQYTQGILFNKQAPAKTSVSITLNVTVSPNCGPTSASFHVAGWTGSPGPLSTSFPESPAGPYLTPIAAAPAGTCSLGFTAQPHGAQVSTNITSKGSDPNADPVAVAMFNGANIDATYTGPISLVIKSGTGGFPGNGAVLSAGGPNNAVAGVATFPGLQIDQVGMNYQLTASGGGAVAVDSTAFSIFANGQIGCVGGKDANTNNYNSSLGKGNFTFDPDGNATPTSSGWGLRRGANKDGLPCVLVDYTFTPPTGANGNVASMLFDHSTGQKASWKYLVTWTSIAVDAGGSTQGWTTFRPFLSWGIDNPNTAAGSTDFVPALFCLDDPGDLTQRTPAQLFALLPTMPNDCAVNGPFCKANAAHPDIYKLADAANPAKMCISQQGFSTGAGNMLFPWSEVVDEGDSYVKPGN
jgi:hypothetical protein